MVCGIAGVIVVALTAAVKGIERVCSLQPLQAYLSFLRSLRKTLFDLCPTMAVLFVLVLLAFVKDVAGMRGPPQAASMLEREVTLWGKKCAQFGAKKKSWWQSNICQCPKELPFPRNCEGRDGHSFNLKKTIKEGSDCHCEEIPSCEKFGAEDYWYNTCQCPKERPVPRKCEGGSGRSFNLKKNIKEGSDCHCEEIPSCEKFGAEDYWYNTCQCPKERPVPRKCEGGSGRSFNLKKNIKEGSNCRCEEDPCAKYGAESNDEDWYWCKCPKELPFIPKECGRGESYFRHSEASKGCRCLSKVEATERLSKIPVAASALRFCDALAEQSYKNGWGDMEGDMEDALNKTSPEICQHALTGTITPQEAEEAPFAAKASKLSQHGSDMDGNQDGDRAYGRMRAVKEDATGSTETALWKDALARVCKDECEDLLKMMKKETKHLEKDVYSRDLPFAQACAERVVQHVEAEVLGCCGRSCGFNGRRCLLWPFFSPKEKVEWELECCAEMNVLKNSSRELMCNSVLPDRLAKKASNFDLEEQNGTDVGKVLLGQNSSLVWTKEGAQESALGKEIQAHGGEKVSMEFLIKHKRVGEEYLRLGYFKEKPVSKMLDESTSLMEVSSQDGTCDFGKFEHQCPKEWMDTYTNRCKEAWMVADEKEEPFMDQITDHFSGNCSVNDYIEVSAPEHCKNIATNSLNQKIFLHYFEYNNENSKKPIKCFTLSKEQCKGEAGWWTNISLKSVQDVIKEEEIRNYKHLVYVKLKAD